MTATRYDAVGIGNAIVDIIARAEDATLSRLDLPKGFMRLIEADEADRLYTHMGPAIERSGGSAANTIAGLASFGGRAGFIGRVADDPFGAVFAHDIRSVGVAFETAAANGANPTARCLIFVTPDGERTMNTFLGASVDLGPAELDAEMIGAAEVVYLEGYLFDKPEAQAAFHQAAEIAMDAGRKVALTLSDPFCVDRHRGAFRALVRDRVDILFANENEITSLYQTDSFASAAEAVRNEAAIAVLTRSELGSVILAGGTEVAVPAHPVDKVVDATGAGDLYAAGFLYGLTHGYPLETSGALASLAAAEIISHLGARPETPLAELAKKHGLLG